MKRALIICFGLVLAGCVSPKTSQTLSWSSVGMKNLVLELKDPKIIEQYFFGPNGVVGATLGEKNGAIVAPVFFWRAKNDLLFIRDEDGKPEERLRLIDQTPSELIVQRKDGTEAVYAIKRR